MYISDNEVRTNLRYFFDNHIPPIDSCVPILRGGHEILKRIPDEVKMNWNLYPITVKSYSDEHKKTYGSMKIDIPSITLDFLLNDKDTSETILVVDDVYHTGNTLEMVKQLVERFHPNTTYYLAYVNKSGLKNFGNPHFPKNVNFVKEVDPTDWVEFEWERNR